MCHLVSVCAAIFVKPHAFNQQCLQHRDHEGPDSTPVLPSFLRESSCMMMINGRQPKPLLHSSIQGLFGESHEERQDPMPPLQEAMQPEVCVDDVYCRSQWPHMISRADDVRGVTRC